MEDLHKKWPHRWVTPKARAMHSKIHGTGVEAIEDIEKGEIVFVLGGIIVPSSEIKEYQKKVGDFGTKINDDFWIVPSSKEEIEVGGAVNHSCDPNLGFNGEISVIAIKDIKTGEELTMDYALYHTAMENMGCNCGSENCRKIIKSTDWMIKELQEKYYEYFSPYLKEKIKLLTP